MLPVGLGCLLGGDVVRWFYWEGVNSDRATVRLLKGEYVTISTSAAEIIRRAPEEHHIRLVRLYQKQPEQALELARSLS